MITEVSTAAAARTLAERGIARREPPGGPGTLWAVDACTLLDADALAVLPTVGVDSSFGGFGGWDCQYSDDVEPETRLQLVFARGSPLEEDFATSVPTPIGPVYTQTEDNRCFARFAYRPAGTDAEGEPVVEIVRIRVEGPQPEPERCSAAVSLAVAVGERLPPPA